MMRIHLNGERVALGTMGINVDPEMWDSTLGKVRGRTKEALATNAQLTSFNTDLQVIFQRLEFSEELSLERIKSEYLGKREAMETVLSLFTKYNNDMYAQIGCGVSKANYRKFDICKRHITNFLEIKYARTDLNAIELTPIVIHDFDVYLRTIVGQSFNTAIKTLKTFETVIIFGRKAGVFNYDPFSTSTSRPSEWIGDFLQMKRLILLCIKNLLRNDWSMFETYFCFHVLQV